MCTHLCKCMFVCQVRAQHSACTTPEADAWGPRPSWLPDLDPLEKALRGSVHATPSPCHMPPPRKACASLEEAEVAPMHDARPAPLHPLNGSGQGRGGYWLLCAGTREVARKEGNRTGRRKATVPGLTYQPEQRSPTGRARAKGVPSDRGRRQSGRRGDRRGERQTRTTCH